MAGAAENLGKWLPATAVAGGAVLDACEIGAEGDGVAGRDGVWLMDNAEVGGEGESFFAEWPGELQSSAVEAEAAASARRRVAVFPVVGEGQLSGHGP